MNDPTVNKKILRDRLRRARSTLDAAQRQLETAACAKILIRYVQNKLPTAIASYMAIGNEMALDVFHTYWWSTGAALWLPRVQSAGQLSWHAVTTPGQFLGGAFGIREPDPAVHPAASLPSDALIIVPGVGFTADGHRLGQGQGYYDRALTTHRGPTIGVGFSCQQCETLPIEAHDRRLDGVVLGDRTVLIPP